MDRKYLWIAGALVLVGLAVLTYIYWPALVGDRPTLMYFRADL